MALPLFYLPQSLLLEVEALDLICNRLEIAHNIFVTLVQFLGNDVMSGLLSVQSLVLLLQLRIGVHQQHLDILNECLDVSERYVLLLQVLAFLHEQREVLNLLEEVVAEQRDVVLQLALHLCEALKVIIFEEGPLLDLKGEVMIEVIKETLQFCLTISL